MKKIKQLIFLFSFLMFAFFNMEAQSLYDLDTLRSIYINFENPNWHENLVMNWELQNGERETASLEMDGVVYEDVAIRYKGNATFFIANDGENPKLPLNIDMNDLVEDQSLLGFNKVKLASSFFDPSILRDVYGFKIYRDYMPSPEANWMKVYIDGEYIGLYPNTESINRQFLEKHFDYKDGTFFKCDPSSQFGSPDPWTSPDLSWYGADSTAYYSRYDLKSETGWGDLVHLIDVLNNHPEELENILNIDRALWYLAVSTAIANYDSYNGLYIHNYYLYQHEDGLFQFIPWDVSESFIGILWGGSPAEKQGLLEWDIFLEVDPANENRALLDYVKTHPVYRKQYLAHIRTIIEEVLDIPSMTEELEELQTGISEAALEDVNTFFTLGTWYFESNVNEHTNFFGLEVAGIVPAIEGRKEYLINHPEMSLVPPQISDVVRIPEAPFNGEMTYVTAFVENATQVDLMVTNNGYASFFQSVEMFDDGLHNDGEAGDQIFGAVVPFTEGGDFVQYYVRAQNAEAMRLNPERAEYEFYEYTVSMMTSVLSDDGNLASLKVYPNPVEDIVYLDAGNVELKELAIFDVMGRSVGMLEVELLGAQYRLDLSGVESGVYFLKVVGFAPVRVVVI